VLEISTADEARALLANLGAPERLLQHTVLVGEAADALLRQLGSLRIPIDATFVTLGVVFHDAGKILYPRELAEPGSEHEPAGETLLVERGVDPSLARCCVSHARWAEMEVSLEELIVALADKLWKGKREASLEKVVVERAGERAKRDFGDLFIAMDKCFEEIAAEGHGRLARSAG
jgi:hypothetical protein